MLFMIHERFSSSSIELMWRMHLEFDVYAANCMHDRFSIWYTWQFGCQWVCKFCNEQMMTLTMATTASQPATPSNLPLFHFIPFATKAEEKFHIKYQLGIQQMRFHLVALNIHGAPFTTALSHCVRQKSWKKKWRMSRSIYMHTMLLQQTHIIHTHLFWQSYALMCHSQIAKSLPPIRQCESR